MAPACLTSVSHLPHTRLTQTLSLFIEMIDVCIGKKTQVVVAEKVINKKHWKDWSVIGSAE